LATTSTKYCNHLLGSGGRGSSWLLASGC